MKKYTLLLTLFCLCAAIQIHAQLTYTTQFKSTLSQRISKMIITADGGSIITTSKPDSALRTRIVFSKIKANGTPAWAKDYGTANRIISIQSVSRFNGNGVLACLSSTNYSFGDTKLLIINLDSSGNIVWQREVRSLNNQIGESFSGLLTATKDGGFYYVQQNTRFYSDYMGPHCSLYKFDGDGNIIWSNQFNIEAESDYGTWITDLTETSDKGIVMAITTLGCETYCYYFYLMKFNSNGKFEWKYDNNKSINSYGTPIQLLTADENNNVSFIFQGGYPFSRSNIYTYAWLNTKTGVEKDYQVTRTIFNLQAFLRKNGINEVKEKCLKSFPGDNTNGYAFSNIYGFDNNWNLLNGTYKEKRSNGLENILLEKYDKTGRICPQFEPAELTDSVSIVNINCIKSTAFHFSNDEEITITETNDLSAQRYTIDLKIYCAAMPADIAAIAVNPLQSPVKIYPNPVTDILNIEGLVTNFNTRLTITDLNGNVHMYTTTNGAKYTWNISRLQRGSYILRVQTKNAIVNKSFIRQ